MINITVRERNGRYCGRKLSKINIRIDDASVWTMSLSLYLYGIIIQ